MFIQKYLSYEVLVATRLVLRPITHYAFFRVSFRVLRSSFIYLPWLKKFFTALSNKKMTQNLKTHAKKHVVCNGPAL